MLTRQNLTDSSLIEWNTGCRRRLDEFLESASATITRLRQENAELREQLEEREVEASTRESTLQREVASLKEVIKRNSKVSRRNTGEFPVIIEVNEQLDSAEGSARQTPHENRVRSTEGSVDLLDEVNSTDAEISSSSPHDIPSKIPFWNLLRPAGESTTQSQQHETISFDQALSRTQSEAEKNRLELYGQLDGDLATDDAIITGQHCTIQAASHVGPPSDKGNEDSFAVWVARETVDQQYQSEPSSETTQAKTYEDLPQRKQPRGRPEIAVAIADGVTSSLLADCGSSLCVASGLSALVNSTLENPGAEALELAQRKIYANFLSSFNNNAAPINKATVARDMKAYLKRRRILQSTLCLVWIEDKCLHFSAVGDSGLCVEWIGSRGQLYRECLKDVDDAARTVSLGPHQQFIDPADIYQLVLPLSDGVRNLNRVAAYTDQVGRGVKNCPDELFDSIDDHARHNNAAQSLLQSFVDDRPNDFDDNLTLVVINCL